jgi:predicted phosphoribosyltransferase
MFQDRSDAGIRVDDGPAMGSPMRAGNLLWKNWQPGSAIVAMRPAVSGKPLCSVS